MVVCTKFGEKQLLDALEHVCGSRTNPKDATDEQLQLARKRVDPHDTINVVELVLGMREEAKKKAQAEQIAQAERAVQQEAAAEEAAAKDAQRIRDAQAEAAAAEKQVQKEIAEAERVIAERDRAMESSRAALESNPGAFERVQQIVSGAAASPALGLVNGSNSTKNSAAANGNNENRVDRVVVDGEDAAARKEQERAHRRMAAQLHPDRKNGDGTAWHAYFGSAAATRPGGEEPLQLEWNIASRDPPILKNAGSKSKTKRQNESSKTERRDTLRAALLSKMGGNSGESAEDIW